MATPTTTTPNVSIARLMALAVAAGATAEEALALARPLTRQLRQETLRARRRERRKAIERAEVLLEIEDGGLHCYYSAAELHALSFATTVEEVGQLMREWEDWEAWCASDHHRDISAPVLFDGDEVDAA